MAIHRLCGAIAPALRSRLSLAPFEIFHRFLIGNLIAKTFFKILPKEGNLLEIFRGKEPYLQLPHRYETGPNIPLLFQKMELVARDADLLQNIRRCESHSLHSNDP